VRALESRNICLVFRFLHAADIHLDSPLRGLSRYEGAPVEALRNATRRALENLVQTAIERRVDFMVIAGDLYDGDWKDYNTAQFLVRQMSRLEKAGIQVIAISGNHDAQSKLTGQLKIDVNLRLMFLYAV
jgi:DNA repair exonuclease SbcCD nuclease subunit